MTALLRRAGLLATLLLLGACATSATRIATAEPTPVVVAEEPPLRWKGVATAPDADRLSRLGEAWAAALSDVRRSRSSAAFRVEGELLDPNAALPRPAPPPGPYRCRVVKLGRDGRGPAIAAFPPFFCYVEAEDDILTIVKQTGSQRPAGRIYPDAEPTRLVFLGTLALGSEEEPLPYGERTDRDMAGVVERVAPFRWRLVLPWPQSGGKLQVIELVPATG